MLNEFADKSAGMPLSWEAKLDPGGRVSTIDFFVLEIADVKFYRNSLSITKTRGLRLSTQDYPCRQPPVDEGGLAAPPQKRTTPT